MGTIFALANLQQFAVCVKKIKREIVLRSNIATFFRAKNGNQSVEIIGQKEQSLSSEQIAN